MRKIKKVNVNKAFFIVMGFFLFIFTFFSISKPYSFSNRAENKLEVVKKRIVKIEDTKKKYKTSSLKPVNINKRKKFDENNLNYLKNIRN